MSGIFFERQKFEEKEEELNKMGYKYLGWQVNRYNSSEIKEHIEKNHTSSSKSYSQRGSHDAFWCDDCKIWWNIDCSD